jgi:peptide/nickel transport system substrate-binding protein
MSRSGVRAAPQRPQRPAAAKRVLTVLSHGGFGELDPGRAQFQYDQMLAYAVHRPLYSYRPDDAGDPSPDLAVAPPSIASGDRLVIRLRRGVRFAPPVDREVTAADVKYGLERALAPDAGNDYVHLYFRDVEGLDEFRDGSGEIAGIDAAEPWTLTITLRRPTFGTVTKALSLPLSAPLPVELREAPASAIEQVATGPYTLAESEARRTVLVRNPSWQAATDYRPAYLDGIVFEHGHDDPDSASCAIIAGEGLVNGDFMPPPPLVRELLADPRRRTQLDLLADAGACRFVALNTRVPPLDDLDVRRAIFAAFDREAMLEARGGRQAGEVATHIIPPGIPGFEEAGGTAGPDLDYLREPRGDPTLAAQYLERAGYPGGRIAHDRPLLVVGSSTGDARTASTVARRQLEQLGFVVDFHRIETAQMYKRCGRPSEAVAVSPSVGWIKDFPDAETIIPPLFDGRAIRPEGSNNWSQLDDPTVNAAIDRARLVSDPAQRARAWAELDLMLMERAPMIPLDWDKVPNIRSQDVVGIVNRSRAVWDLCFTSIAAGR